MKQLQIIILNGCLRWKDSAMITNVNPLHPTLFLLLVIGGDHKQKFDQCMAHRLPVRVISVSPRQVQSIRRLAINSHCQLTVLHQALQEIEPFLQELRDITPAIEFRQFNDSLAVPFDLFTPVFSLFNERVKNKVAAPDSAVLHRQFKQVTLPASLRNRTIKACSQKCYPQADQVFAQFKEVVERGYSKSRQMFGELFSYDPVSSSFMSPFISAGCVTIRQLYALSSDSTYKQELIWNQYCICYMKQFGDRALQEYGPYDRRRRWCSKTRQRQLVNQLLTYTTEEPLMNAIMNQLIKTGYVPNRLRMVFASWLAQQGLPWRTSAQIFEQHLIDFDFRSNTFNWLFCYNLTSGNQHTFSIERQLKKFDPKGHYIAKWGPAQDR